MQLTLMSSLVAFILPTIVCLIAWIMSMKSMTSNREKTSPFECGFDPLRSARIPFSMRFFLLAVIFIVFDIEIVLLIPLPILLTKMNLDFLMISSISFLIILILGLLYEWWDGSLNWKS